ncbi:MAG: 2-oxoacid:acceptor oxidoreductase family protein [Candidatus Rokubacteria bacterium]|nr:2-oxoacid:acceptor oxidoreductase family protein [Candidatus Rokubacteria bacterium]MBI2554671.1 2-oxoacid:acceptor oxidoreductase family protein [Candidatus Rokubacteria bacterium]
MSPAAPQFPGITATADGSETVVWVETHITQGACAYPITSSTNMGAGYQAAQASGKKNLWGEPLFFLELESEHSSASTCEGFALAGGRVTNFTSGQGLVLMKEVLYTIAGKRLPVVFHVGSRALTSQALNVHCGHDDVMAVADTGWGIAFAKNAQEAGDLALILRRAAEEGETPFLSVQDGFLTTHTVENVRLLEPELMAEFVGDPYATTRLRNLMNPAKPIMSGVVQNQDAYMKGKIAQRYFTDRLAGILTATMKRFEELTGRRYGLVAAYRLEDADYALVGMGSLVETATATADWLRAERGLRVGVLGVTVFRPFPAREILEALRSVRALAIVERMDNPLAQSNPLAAEIKAAFADAASGAPGLPRVDRVPAVHAAAAGLGSRDVRPGDFVAAVDEMARSGRRTFVLGIRHDLALPRTVDPDVRPRGAFSMRGHSVGGFGSVTTNRVIATILGDLFALHVQAYPLYGSEKKGLPTTYFLTVAEERIRTHSELTHVDFVPLNDVNAFHLGNPLAGIAEGGMVFIQTAETDPAAIWAKIPAEAQAIIRERRLRILALDTQKIARETTSRPELQVRMQGIVLLGIFLRATPFLSRLPYTDAEIDRAVERSMRKFFGKRGEAVIQENLRAVRRGFGEVFEVPVPAGPQPTVGESPAGVAP